MKNPAAFKRLLFLFAICAVIMPLPIPATRLAAQTTTSSGAAWEFRLRYREETSPNSGRFHTLTRTESWDPIKTAVIVCDVWDSHHSFNAVCRVEELAPRIDQFLKHARGAGATIIHAPSDCTAPYSNHPCRKRTTSVPAAKHYPPHIKSWCNQIETEKNAVYPIDQSDGGDDDETADHVAWVKQLREQGRVIGTPWQKQSPLIDMDGNADFISDRGDEVWNILESRGIENVILCGVHTNMCVLGRPFGLRNMVAAGKRVALVRDLTDTMYNPERWPFVNHHTGTDLVVEYIERYICPTLTSDQLLGGQALRFHSDARPTLAIVIGEDEYETERTLPEFATRFLGNDYRVVIVFASEKDPNDFPGLEVLEEADAALISVRRRTLPKHQLDIVRRFVAVGKPLIGIRTASHAFCLRNGQPASALEAWPEFDRDVWGGNYSDHYANEDRPTIEIVTDQRQHPAMAGMNVKSFLGGGSLYRTSPLADSATAVLMGKVADKPAEPVAWIFQRSDGGRSFYTSLGHKLDFENPEFVRLLFNGISWATGREGQPLPDTKRLDDVSAYWGTISLPGIVHTPADVEPNSGEADFWFRCFFKLPDVAQGASVQLQLVGAEIASAWVNGKPVAIEVTERNAIGTIPADALENGELNALVVRCTQDQFERANSTCPTIVAGGRRFELNGRWQFRMGVDPMLSGLPLPAKFGASPDAVFDFATADKR